MDIINFNSSVREPQKSNDYLGKKKRVNFLNYNTPVIQPLKSNQGKSLDIMNTGNGNFNLKTIKNNKLAFPKSLSFKARPWELPYMDVKNPYDAMALYTYFQKGNYLDASDDDVSFDNKNIRKHNLGFLDALTSEKDKKTFINYYKEVTGFPDLKKVSGKIEREFILGVKKSSVGIDGAECISAGYDGTCSVGKGKAFPGSDLDKAYIILKGSSDHNKEKDNEIVDKFKSNLWNNTDQRILSFNHDISFPTVYTAKQVRDGIKYVDEKTKYVDVDNEHLSDLMDSEYVNLEKAAEYNIAISEKFPVTKSDDDEMSKEDVKNLGYFVESVRDGKSLIRTYSGDDLKDDIKDSNFYKYSNLAQMRAMKKAVNEGRENKNKIRLRDNMSEKFNRWNTDKQYNFVKTLIKYSCEDNDDFKEYFTNDRNVKDAYKPLLNQVTQGDKDLYNRPEYEKTDSGLHMIYAKGKSVDLYKGYSDNVLWIDKKDSVAIKQVCRQINKIKQCEIFKKVDKIQCPSPDEHIKDFYPIKYKTIYNETIYQKDLK